MKKQSKTKRVAVYLRVGSREQLSKDSLPGQDSVTNRGGK